MPVEHWFSRKLRFALGTPVAIGDYFYGATDNVILGADFQTGKRTSAKRGYTNASVVYASGKLIILDENGKLSLATATPEDLTIHAQHQISERYSLTVPALVGHTLYVRDRKHIMAFDLG